jgi:hypothetical protein
MNRPYHIDRPRRRGSQTESLAIPDLFSSLGDRTILFPPEFTPPGRSSVAASGLCGSVPGEFSSDGFPPLPGDDLESSGSTTGEREDPRLGGCSPPTDDDPVVSGQGDNGEGFFCSCDRDGAAGPQSG